VKYYCGYFNEPSGFIKFGESFKWLLNKDSFHTVGLFVTYRNRVRQIAPQTGLLLQYLLTVSTEH
jgi:hypothetical protein